MQSPIDAHNPALLYKGKVTNRSWPQLPEELIRLVATHYLWDAALTNYCPQTWENRRLWHSRMVYTCIRDGLDLEKHVMSICPEWHRAISKHLFWKQAISLVDCNDLLLHHMVIHPKPQLNASSATAQSIYLTPFQHLRNILNCSCHVCRINYPYTTSGLTAAKRSLGGSLLGPVHLCREHDRRRGKFCGLCLRDLIVTHAQDATVRDFELAQSIAILDNEDEDTWPNVEATCKKCRAEWLWRRASANPRDREAIGGPSLQSDDWETRQCVDGFVELAEGAIADVLTLAREKLWLKRYTKYESLGQHALAAQKTTRDDQEEEEEEDSEEDRELMLMRDANQVREMSLHDWARQRILDGHWLCPADVWYHFEVPGQPTSVPALHPCSWAREVDGEPVSSDDEARPQQSVVDAEIPPTFGLCEQAYAAYMKQMREILAHPLRNVVRKVIMECAIPTAKGYEDPGLKASKMSIEDVVRVLREEEGIWYDGVDWIERKRNEEESSRRHALEETDAMTEGIYDIKDQDRSRKEDDSASTTSSSNSSGSAKYSTHSSSSTTSPVLSTTTLQTTPSPPPLSEEGDSKKEEESSPQQSLPSRPRIIPVDPVRATPQMLSSIPYIPVTTTHLPQYSLDALKIVWRDACAPLYHCRCSVCERAKMVEAAARAAYAALSAPVVLSQQPVQPTLQTTIYPQTDIQTVDAAEIELKEVCEIELDGDGEDEVYEASDLEYDDDDDDDDDGSDPRYIVDGVEYSYSASPEAEIDHSNQENTRTRSRKRSSDELEGEEEQEDLAASVTSISSDPPPVYHRPDQREQGGTPPKRARIGHLERDDDDDDRSVGSVSDAASVTATHGAIHAESHSPTRPRKRSSEELEGDDGSTRVPDILSSIHSKRAKVEIPRILSRDVPAVQSPTSSTGEEVAYSPMSAADDDNHRHPRDWIRKSDMDGLIVLDDVDDT